MENNTNFSFILENSIGKFYRSSIRDIETVFCLKNTQYYINYSYIVNNYVNNVKGFRNIIVSKQFFEDLKIYCKNNNIEFTREITFENINDLINETNFFFNVHRSNTNNITSNIQGTFGPIDFIDIILFNLSSEYRQEVHNLMDSIQNLANVTNNTFRGELERTIEELQTRIQELTEENINLRNKNNKLIKEAKFRNTVVSQLKVKFHSDEMESLRAELNKKFEEQQRRFDEAEFRANERFLKSEERSNLRTNRIISKIEGNTKPN